MSTDANFPQDIDLNDLRLSIDLLDSSLMFLLAERTRLMIKVCLLKKHYHLPIAYSDKRKKDLEIIFNMAEKERLSRDFIQRFYDRIYQESAAIIERLPENPEIFTFENKERDSDGLLKDIRKSFFNVDMAICHVLLERFRTVSKVGVYKKLHGIKPLASKRFQQVLAHKIEIANQLNINEDFVVDIFNMIHDYALSLERA